jgi:tripartite-type tricarboxylate transporter receptor subunit TctC
MSGHGLRSAVLTALCAVSLAVPAHGQGYPSRPITMIEPFPPGGPTDAIARIIAEGMRLSLGQPVIIENVSGAGGTIGVARLARATPDGYTIGIGQPVSHVFSGAVYNVRYDLLNDFEPIALLASSPLWVLGSASLPANSIRELIAWLKANPDKASFGMIGQGSPSHVWAIHFQTITGTRFQFVPYRGAAAVMQELVAGRVDLSGLEAPFTLPQVRSGKIKAYVVLGDTRWPGAPEIPTIAETGVGGLSMSLWYGLWCPKGTPKDIVARLNAAAVAALADPALARRLADLGQELLPRAQQTPEALGALQKAEIAKWWPIITAAHIKAE